MYPGEGVSIMPSNRESKSLDATGTVARTVALLRVIAESEEPLSVTTIAGRLGLPTSTTHRLLQLLRKEDLVEGDPQTRLYGTGSEFVRLGFLIRERSSLVNVTQRHLQAIADATGETAQMVIPLWSTPAMTVVSEVQSSHALRFAARLYEVGSLVWGCSGRCLLAYASDDIVKKALSIALPAPGDDRPPPSLADLQAELSAIRARGWAESLGEKLPHAHGFAVPVFSGASVVCGIGIVAPVTRYDRSKHDFYVDLLLEQAAKVTATLGSGSQ